MNYYTPDIEVTSHAKLGVFMPTLHITPGELSWNLVNMKFTILNLDKGPCV